MKKVTAYEADDGSLWHERSECAVRELVRLTGFNTGYCDEIVAKREKIMAVLAEIDAAEAVEVWRAS